MNKTTGYNVNFTTKTITLTRAFAKKAGTYGTPEFEAFIGLRNAFPDFAVEYKAIEKKENKVSYSGLSIHKMIAFVQLKDSKEAAVEFEKFVAVYDGEKGKYPTIKKVFLAKYKEEYNTLSEDDTMAVAILADKIAKGEVVTDETRVAVMAAA